MASGGGQWDLPIYVEEGKKGKKGKSGFFSKKKSEPQSSEAKKGTQQDRKEKENQQEKKNKKKKKKGKNEPESQSPSEDHGTAETSLITTLQCHGEEQTVECKEETHSHAVIIEKLEKQLEDRDERLNNVLSLLSSNQKEKEQLQAECLQKQNDIARLMKDCANVQKDVKQLSDQILHVKDQHQQEIQKLEDEKKANDERIKNMSIEHQATVQQLDEAKKGQRNMEGKLEVQKNAYEKLSIKETILNEKLKEVESAIIQANVLIASLQNEKSKIQQEADQMIDDLKKSKIEDERIHVSEIDELVRKHEVETDQLRNNHEREMAEFSTGKKNEIAILQEQLTNLESEKLNFKSQLDIVKRQTGGEHKEQRDMQFLLRPDTETPTSLSSQSTDGAGANSLSESDKQVADLTNQLREKEEEIDRLSKQLTSEAKSFHDKKLQLEEQITHMVDRTVLMVQEEEYEKAQKHFEDERKHYKTVEATNVQLQQEIQQLRLTTHQSTMPSQIKELTEIMNIPHSGKPHSIGTEFMQQLRRTLREKDDRIHHLEDEKSKMENEIQQLVSDEQKIRRDAHQKIDDCLKKVEEDKRSQEAQFKKERQWLTAKVAEKDQVNRELNEHLLKLKAEFQARKEDLGVEISHQLQQIEDLRDVSDGMKRKVEVLLNEKDELTKEISTVTEDLGVAQQQIAYFREDIEKFQEEKEAAKKTIAYLKGEIEKNAKFLSKHGKKSLDEILRAYEDMKESKKQMEEERSGYEQQVRAYKRQVDEVKESLRKLNEEKQSMQVELDIKDKFKNEATQLQAQVSKLTEDMKKMAAENHEKAMCESRLGLQIDEIKTISEKTKQANIVLQQKKTLQDQQIAMMSQELEGLRSGNMILQQKLRTAWGEIDALQDQILALKLKTDHHDDLHPPQGGVHGHNVGVGEKVQNHHSDAVLALGINHGPNNPYKSHTTIIADRALKDAEFARKNYDMSKKELLPVPIQHPPANPDPKSQSERQAEDIGENPILQGIDRDIQGFADGVRKQTQPPQTQEFLEHEREDDATKAIPYDPNLTCQWCGQRYRFGEIQKLRRHVNEFCIARQYTRTI